MCLVKCVKVGGGGGGGGRRQRLKSQNQLFRNRFSFQKLYLRNERKDGGKSIHFLKVLLKTYSKTNIW